MAKGADVLVTEVTSPNDVVEVFKRNGIWQAKTPAEQEGFIRHMKEAHVTPEEVGKMAAKAGVKSVVLTHFSRPPIPKTTTNATSTARRNSSRARSSWPRT
jgi:ribonuclease BN (tRNA processing enzyme)